jgi:hypothetical protein
VLNGKLRHQNAEYTNVDQPFLYKELSMSVKVPVNYWSQSNL